MSEYNEVCVMNLDFVSQIQVAEEQAASIIREAENKARTMTESARREQLTALENARNEADNQRRDYITNAESSLRGSFNQQHREVKVVEVDTNKVQQAAWNIAERIVSYLGNR